MIYQIRADYQTGDSNGYEDTYTVLEMKWENLDKAKAALARIKEHYKWYDDHHGRSYSRKEQEPEPKWHKGMQYEFCIKLELDNGNEVQFTAPWCGYFEKLYGAKIIQSGDTDMEFTVNERY